LRVDAVEPFEGFNETCLLAIVKDFAGDKSDIARYQDKERNFDDTHYVAT
jgi:hypothetical protein